MILKLEREKQELLDRNVQLIQSKLVGNNKSASISLDSSNQRQPQLQQDSPSQEDTRLQDEMTKCRAEKIVMERKYNELYKQYR